MANEAQKKATMGQVKALIRRKLRKREEHQEESLNIYPMMDMMTILLVFLVMQFANATADIQQSSELQIPYSTSDVVHEPAVSVVVSRSAITVEGEEVLTLRNGQVDPSQKQGGGTGFLITPLLTVMQQHRDLRKEVAQARNQPFEGHVQIIGDKRMPFRTLTEVIYTLGQAEFKSLRFVVQQGT